MGCERFGVCGEEKSCGGDFNVVLDPSERRGGFLCFLVCVVSLAAFSVFAACFCAPVSVRSLLSGASVMGLVLVVCSVSLGVLALSINLGCSKKKNEY
ncbi:hypothetical protein QYF36_004952 [Acer negundo]|nr:hypothetical protein QYF36_004952 [Acer negundo]